MTNNATVKETGWKYLLLALGAFLGLALEVIHAYGWEPLVYGGISYRDYAVWQAALHSIITCLTWLGAAYLLIRVAQNRLGFEIFEKSSKMKFWQIIAVCLSVILSIVMSYLDWDGFKVVKEFQSNGWLRFIFQYIYYIVETAMFLLIIVFGQKAFDLWTKKKNVPWGGIVCGLTWGISHVISRGFLDIGNGIASMVFGFLFGAAYLLTNRDIKKSWLILFLMFAL